MTTPTNEAISVTRDPTADERPEDRESLLRAIADAYEERAADPDAIAEERAERALWEATLNDGIPSHP